MSDEPPLRDVQPLGAPDHRALPSSNPGLAGLTRGNCRVSSNLPVLLCSWAALPFLSALLLAQISMVVLLASSCALWGHCHLQSKDALAEDFGAEGGC